MQDATGCRTVTSWQTVQILHRSQWLSIQEQAVHDWVLLWVHILTCILRLCHKCAYSHFVWLKLTNAACMCTAESCQPEAVWSDIGSCRQAGRPGAERGVADKARRGQQAVWGLLCRACWFRQASFEPSLTVLSSWYLVSWPARQLHNLKQKEARMDNLGDESHAIWWRGVTVGCTVWGKACCLLMHTKLRSHSIAWLEQQCAASASPSRFSLVTVQQSVWICHAARSETFYCCTQEWYASLQQQARQVSKHLTKWLNTLSRIASETVRLAAAREPQTQHHFAMLHMPSMYI